MREALQGCRLRVVSQTPSYMQGLMEMQPALELLMPLLPYQRHFQGLSVAVAAEYFNSCSL